MLASNPVSPRVLTLEAISSLRRKIEHNFQRAGNHVCNTSGKYKKWS